LASYTVCFFESKTETIVDKGKKSGKKYAVYAKRLILSLIELLTEHERRVQNMRKTGIVAALLLMGVSQTVMAANKEGAFSLSPVVGGYTFESKQHKDTSIVLGGRAGYNFTERIGVEALIDYTHAKGNSGTKAIDFYRYGGELLYHMFPKNDLVPYLAVGVGGVTASQGGGNKLAFDYGLGVKYFMTDNLALRADVRGINYKFDKYYTNVEYTLGFYIPFLAPKPAPAPAPVVEVAAPKAAPVVVVPPAPTTTLNTNPSVLEKGKTTILSWSSTNATGCEIQPDIGPVAPSGSKVITPVANTRYILTCSGEGGKASSAAGVELTEPVKEAVAAKATAAGTKLDLDILFDTGKSDIKKKYHAELQKVGDVLNTEKNLRGVIEGHTDTVGGRAMNMRLSQRRADSVRTYIIKNFKIDKSRLAAKGFGPDQPIADNKTAEGRQLNRRIHALFEENPNFREALASEQKAAPAKPVKKAVKKKKAAKKQIPAKQ
jgi:OmpA-OmpF porin, OOP family